MGSAYGVAVTGTMAITTVLFCFLARQRWRWPPSRVAAVAVVFLGIDLAFFSSNMTKVRQGGWGPLAVPAGLFLPMRTPPPGRRWRRGFPPSGETDKAGTRRGHRCVPHGSHRTGATRSPAPSHAEQGPAARG